MSRRRSTVLHHQALRLPLRARTGLFELANELKIAECDMTVAEVARGLCLLALELALGSAGATIADVFRLAASNPSASSVSRARDAFLWLLEVEPRTMPRVSDAHASEPKKRTKRSHRDLANQSLRLPRCVQVQLESLAVDLWAAGSEVTTAEVTRGLCLLAVEIVHGAAGTDIANAFRIAASDPTADGARRAVIAVRSLFEGGPATMPDPPWLDDEAPSTVPDPGPPSTLPVAA